MKSFLRFVEDVDEKAAFEAAIRANPTEATTHLVYADWLEERAQTKQEHLEAEFRRAMGQWLQTRPKFSEIFPSTVFDVALPWAVWEEKTPNYLWCGKGHPCMAYYYFAYHSTGGIVFL